MRAVVQRVRSARVVVAEECTGRIEHGLLVYLGVGNGDGEAEVAWLARKLLALRIFPEPRPPAGVASQSGINDDAEGKMNRSVVDVGAAVLVVSQFTLYADVARGNRPSFGGAAPPELAEALYLRFVAAVGEHVTVATGRFRADMQVESVGYGPVTIGFDTLVDAPALRGQSRPHRAAPEDAAARFVANLKGGE